jgi:hypothetical protein
MGYFKIRGEGVDKMITRGGGIFKSFYYFRSMEQKVIFVVKCTEIEKKLVMVTFCVVVV